MPKTIGVLSLQGDFEKHIQTITRLGARARAVRHVEDLRPCHGLVLPGGESTTIGMLLQRHGLDIGIQQKIQEGMPIFGTCAGMILLANSIEGRAELSFSALNIRIERNAYGSQIDSFEARLDIATGEGLISSFPVVFIRSPRISYCPPETEVLAEMNGYPVMVRQGPILACSFHPELTEDSRIHEFFINVLCRDYRPEAPEDHP